jgi:two-component system sensor histidine kinase SenX3
MGGVAIGVVVGLVLGGVIARVIATRRGSTDAGSVDRSPAPAVRTEVDEEAARLREAINHLEIGVLVAAPTGAIVYRNLAADAFRGTHTGALVDDQVSATVKQAQTGERVVRIVELQGPPKSWLAISAEPTPEGGAVITTEDVTERMRIDSMRTDFVTNISHELKTPVGAIAVLAEALIDERDPDVVRRLADHLVEESHRAVRTIDDLLQLSQIESNKPGDTVVDLTSVIQAAIARGRIVDAGRGVEVSTFDDRRRVHIRGDERQLVSAVGNLVENAVKYSQPGDVVQVRLRVDDRSVEIMVADQGIGIPARDLDRVFERFYRVDKARSRETGGTGLGLSIVRHVATNHGGEVLVSSQEGEGSTFVLRLPASLLVDVEPHGATADQQDDRTTGRPHVPPDGGARSAAGTHEETRPHE